MTHMRSIAKPLLLSFFTLLSLIFSCHESEAKDCFGSLRKPLTDGGYSGCLDCTETNVIFKRIGDISIKDKTYVMFDLRYKTVPQFPGAQAHGGQSILVFRSADALIYLGQYNLSPPPFHELRVDKTSIRAEPAIASGSEFVFSESGPPAQNLFDGYVVKLAR